MTFANRRALAVLIAALWATAACDSSTAPSSGVTDIQIQELRAGTGAEAANGRTLSVHYTGWLYDASRPENKGTQFDSSAGRSPFQFRLGAGEVIRGWDLGFAGMRVGGQRRLIIPPSLGYGPVQNGPIPPNSTLVFDVELVDVR